MGNITTLNMTTLDGGNVIIKKGGGGGGNAPGKPDIPVIGDGKTHLYIKIAVLGRMNVPLYFSQTVANGVTIDWGDGSAPQTLSGTGDKYVTHKYATVGNYRIELNVADGCTMKFGGSTTRPVMGYDRFPYKSMLWAVEFGKNLEIASYAFYEYYGLKSVVFFGEMQGIGENAFKDCRGLRDIVWANNSVQSIGPYAFQNCMGLQNVALPDSVQNIGEKAINSCQGLASIIFSKNITEILSGGCSYNLGISLLDFSSALAVPIIQSNSFSNAPSDCKIIVPDALYDEWKAATNWSTYASEIIKKTDWDASQTA